MTSLFRNPSLYYLLFIVLVAVVCIRTSSPPQVVSASSPDSVFSAERAYPFLQEIAEVPHSIGTAEHERVRQYIVTKCNQFGLITEIQTTTAIHPFDRGVVAGHVNNVIARLKGTGNSKAVLIMSHYDSEPNACGAGDSGAGVAAMLETARILSSGKPLKNDILFLFTDGEENGLLGAQAFVKESALLKEVALVINFEGRGNAGATTMFEVNPENGWAVKEYIKAAKHPIGNSLSFEVYKNLPNDTDYTVFKEAGITGLNNAFIDGFVNYHSMTDKAANLDLRSFQNHGDNMLSLARHFGTIDLSQTKAPDVSYFNIPGIGVIHYPASIDKWIFILNIILLGLFVVGGLRKGSITLKGFIVGFFLFIATLAILIFASFYFLKGIKLAYPLYKNFHEYNAYNASYYFLAVAFLNIGIISIIYKWAVRKFTLHSLLAGILLVLLILTVLLYISMPTATYIICFPMSFTLISSLITLLLKKNSPAQLLIYTLFSLPAVLLLIPTLYFMFIAFGLGTQAPAAAIILGLIAGLLLPVFAGLLKNNPITTYVIPFFICIIALIGGHIHSKFTDKQPLQTSVWYTLDANKNKAYWISNFNTPDFWNVQFFQNPKADTLPGRFGSRIFNDAPMLALPFPGITVQKDTVINNLRQLSMHIHSPRKANSVSLIIASQNPVSNLIINGKVEQVVTQPITYLNYVGLPEQGFDITFDVKPGTPFKFTLIDRSIGLPCFENYSIFAANVIPGPGSNNNTTQVRKTYSLP
jgi:Peptidase family M28